MEAQLFLCPFRPLVSIVIGAPDPLQSQVMKTVGKQGRRCLRRKSLPPERFRKPVTKLGLHRDAVRQHCADRPGTFLHSGRSFLPSFRLREVRHTAAGRMNALPLVKIADQASVLIGKPEIGKPGAANRLAGIS